MAFDVAVGIYLLTLVLMVPLARFSRGGLWTWRISLALLSLYAFGMENVQIARGIDPRFTEVGSVQDQIMGGMFFLAVVGAPVLRTVEQNADLASAEARSREAHRPGLGQGRRHRLRRLTPHRLGPMAGGVC